MAVPHLDGCGTGPFRRVAFVAWVENIGSKGRAGWKTNEILSTTSRRLLNRSNWWIDEGGVVTCCGISAGIDMSLLLSTSRWTGSHLQRPDKWIIGGSLTKAKA